MGHLLDHCIRLYKLNFLMLRFAGPVLSSTKRINIRCAHVWYTFVEGFVL